MRLFCFFTRASLAQKLRAGASAAMSRCGRLVLVGAALGMGASAQAAWPERPIRIIYPFAGGGLGDGVARALAEALTKSLGQPVIVEERGGAGGIVGFQFVRKAAPDGYTLLLSTNSTLTLAPSIYKNLPFDTLNDFTHVAMVATGGNVITVSATSPVRSFADLRREAKSGSLSFGTAGNGSTFHLTAELFNQINGSKMINVPYKGPNQAFIDLMAGQTSVVFGSMGAVPFVQAGRMRALASMTPRRLKAAPEIPTTAELGMPELVLESFFGITAPLGTPAPVVARLNREIAEALKQESVQKGIAALLLEPAPDTSSEYFVNQIRETTNRWRPVIKSAGIELP